MRGILYKKKLVAMSLKNNDAIKTRDFWTNESFISAIGKLSVFNCAQYFLIELLHDKIRFGGISSPGAKKLRKNCEKAAKKCEKNARSCPEC